MEKLDKFLQPVMRNLKAGPQSKDLEDRTASKISAERFSYHWARLTAAYPRQDLGQATMEVYFEHLKVHPESEVADAISGCVCSLKFFPTISEIKEQITDPVCPHSYKQMELNSRERQLAVELETSKSILAKLAAEREQLSAENAALRVDNRALAEESAIAIRETDLPLAERTLESIHAQIATAMRELEVIEARRRGFLKQQGAMLSKAFSQ